MLPTKRLEMKIGIENLWLYILALLKKKERYAYELRHLVEKEYGFLPGEVTAYRVLYSLELGGFVESHVDGSRKYYRITPKGKKELAKGLSTMKTRLKQLSA
jgi:DNA-binding PadR family transcriptional regulator